MSDALDAHWPPDPTHPFLIAAEAHRFVAASTWMEMPDETRLRLLDLADSLERMAGG